MTAASPTSIHLAIRVDGEYLIKNACDGSTNGSFTQSPSGVSCEACLRFLEKREWDTLQGGIAKYREPGIDGKWFLTDFTMEQVERRLAFLEAEVKRLRNEAKHEH